MGFNSAFKGLTGPSLHCLRASAFGDITRRNLVVGYRCFETTYRPYIQGSGSNNPEERRP